ncbi:MAG: alpha-L-fucosidase [Phycisphaerales bacterium JB063]
MMKSALSFFLMLLCLGACVSDVQAGAEKPAAEMEAKSGDAEAVDQDARMAWFRDARFGMFIHFGLYSEAAGVWEGRPMGWVEYFGFRDPAEWSGLLESFNPVGFDADAIVLAAKDAGMKYLVVTSKHHEGFCLFDSQYTDYDVMSTPFGRDIIRELADACRRHDLRFGFYYSIIDLHHADYLPRHDFDPRPADDADFERYIQFMKDQLRELLTNYGPIDVVWFDGEWYDTWDHERAQDMWDFVRDLQPDALINNRIDKGRAGMQGMNTDDHYLGDFGTPEQELLTRNPGEDWETCQTMNRHGNWGWRVDEGNYYTEAELVQQVIACASMGGNMLLNIGPKGDGTIPDAQRDRLEAIGRWMQTHRHTIHGSGASPYTRAPGWGRCTVQGDTLYCHVFDMPTDGQLVLPAIHSGIVSAWVDADADRTPLAVRQRDDGSVVIDLSGVEADPFATVIAVRCDAPPTAPPFSVQPDAQGVLTLDAATAEIHGPARYDAEHESVGYWVEASTYLTWPVTVPAPGRYAVEVTYGCGEDGGGAYAIVLNGARVEADSRTTGGWFDRETDAVGELVVTEAGVHELRINIVEMTGVAVFDFQRLRLRPIAP